MNFIFRNKYKQVLKTNEAETVDGCVTNFLKITESLPGALQKRLTQIFTKGSLTGAVVYDKIT